jgi:hypothetical protein
MRKHDKETQFACFVRNLTERPIPLSIPFGTMERQPKLSSEALLALRAQNRARYSIVADETAASNGHVQQVVPAEEPPAQPQPAATRQKRELL